MRIFIDDKKVSQITKKKMPYTPKHPDASALPKFSLCATATDVLLQKLTTRHISTKITLLTILFPMLFGGAMMDVNDLLVHAVKEIVNLHDGEVFLLRDLFKGYEWNRIPRSNRLLLGTLFLNHINKTNGMIQAIEKTSSGQQKYIVKAI